MGIVPEITSRFGESHKESHSDFANLVIVRTPLSRAFMHICMYIQPFHLSRIKETVEGLQFDSPLIKAICERDNLEVPSFTSLTNRTYNLMPQSLFEVIVDTSNPTGIRYGLPVFSALLTCASTGPESQVHLKPGRKTRRA